MHNLKVFTSNETKEPKQGDQNRLRSPMTGVREHYFDNTKLFFAITFMIPNPLLLTIEIDVNKQ
jgi:hypothetical protein